MTLTIADITNGKHLRDSLSGFFGVYIDLNFLTLKNGEKETVHQKIYKNIPLRLRKAGRVWCGGARETHCATCNNRVTPSKTKEFLRSPCFFRS